MKVALVRRWGEVRDEISYICAVDIAWWRGDLEARVFGIIPEAEVGEGVSCEPGSWSDCYKVYLGLESVGFLEKVDSFCDTLKLYRNRDEGFLYACGAAAQWRDCWSSVYVGHLREMKETELIDVRSYKWHGRDMSDDGQVHSRLSGQIFRGHQPGVECGQYLGCHRNSE